MKLRFSASFFLLSLVGSALASPIPKNSSINTAHGKLYVGAFGGGGSSNSFDAAQFGTAFLTEANGGPLSVNAFGGLNSQSASFFGFQMGYQMQEVLANSSSQWTLSPAAELEGYSMSNSSFTGDLINNTARIPEHDFKVTYPMSRTVLLVNAVLNFNHPSLYVHPYIGFGIGSAILRISGADSTQIDPAEPGINHYNTSTNDNDSVFAGQIKLGLSYDINEYVSLFADYRWLYLASSDFVFGSTVYTGHVETSSWQVKLDAQRYNLGTFGIRVNFS